MYYKRSAGGEMCRSVSRASLLYCELVSPLGGGSGSIYAGVGASVGDTLDGGKKPPHRDRHRDLVLALVLGALGVQYAAESPGLLH